MSDAARYLVLASAVYGPTRLLCGVRYRRSIWRYSRVLRVCSWMCGTYLAYGPTQLLRVSVTDLSYGPTHLLRSVRY
eukprot:3020498-Rhodomonas_salina.4